VARLTRQTPAGRKKFTFKKKTTTATATPATAAPPPTAQPTGAPDNRDQQQRDRPAAGRDDGLTGTKDERNGRVGVGDGEGGIVEDAAARLSRLQAQVGNLALENLTNDRVLLGPGSCGGKDLSLENLSGCIVMVLDQLGAVRMRNITECRVWLGAVQSSVLIYGCERCAITAAARQVRIHDAHRSAFHLFSVSPPVIERSEHILFAPFDLAYPEHAQQMQTCRLPEMTAADREIPSTAHREEAAATWGHHAAAGGGVPSSSSRPTWQRVMDFNWHRTHEPSPHWRYLPAAHTPVPLSVVCRSSAADAEQGKRCEVMGRRGGDDSNGEWVRLSEGGGVGVGVGVGVDVSGEEVCVYGLSGWLGSDEAFDAVWAHQDEEEEI